MAYSRINRVEERVYSWAVQCVRMEEVAWRHRAGCRQEQQHLGRYYVGQKVVETVKGIVLETSMVPACVCGLGTLALTERQEEKLPTAENNWVQRIYKVIREDGRKMGELRENIRLKKHLRVNIVGSRLRWAGHTQKIE